MFSYLSNISFLTNSQKLSWFESEFKKGNIKLIEKSDWKINRIACSFIDELSLINQIKNRNLVKHLHLGMGDGSTVNYFRVNKDIYSSSLSDCIYIDYIDIIKHFLKKIKIDKEILDELAVLLRNELLNNLFDSDTTSNWSKFISIFYILNNHSQKIIPNNFSSILSVNKLGGKDFISITHNKKLMSAVNKFLRHNKPYLFDSEVKLLIRDYIINVFFAKQLIDNHRITIGDFRNFENAVLPNEKYDLVLSSRADSYLYGSDYFFFLSKLVLHLSRKSIYLSDGLVQSYEYSIDENSLFEFIEDHSHLNIKIIVRSNHENLNFPSYVSGIAISREETILPIKPGYKIIDVKNLRTNIQFKKQILWSKLFKLLRNYQIAFNQSCIEFTTSYIDLFYNKLNINNLEQHFMEYIIKNNY